METDADGRVRRFIEKPDPSQITTDTINAGIYVLETATLDADAAGREPLDRARLLPRPARARRPRAARYVHRGYWIDIGTPEKYLQVHRDILRRPLPGGARRPARARAAGCTQRRAGRRRAPSWRAPFYVGPGCRVAAGARVGPDAVLVADVTVGAGRPRRATPCSGTARASGARRRVEGALLGRGVQVGAQRQRRRPGAVLGEGTRLSDFSRTA